MGAQSGVVGEVTMWMSVMWYACKWVRILPAFTILLKVVLIFTLGSSLNSL
jgi:hypothetical protein